MWLDVNQMTETWYLGDNYYRSAIYTYSVKTDTLANGHWWMYGLKWYEMAFHDPEVIDSNYSWVKLQDP